ncbi:hypothetical protein CWI35_13330 [[Bacillus] caldolyticus]|uniref:Uncharacterized protein n=1 Tax=Bacillus caldolyticus TaxID=1394 RepID=A0ABN5FWE2_BACCL|nr:hypothetical protein CWI35_13330 [[Bacillus] caldolyticus]EQB94373.1 hypothetical protein GA8_17350 [Geobacillus sp. A8]KDE45836.1 hypothetical protein DI44_18590 [Geobacillus sp. CAMR5420]KQC48404.1 hypothetical protein AP057_14280 [Geobacillus sp. Sah69]KZE97711.1 hypothetical protein AVP43_00316 [Geobacillus stearothermophilus]PJW13075.1 hypothetical protein CV945_16225 [Geobacillus sp. Manikaran-105]PJW16179.1 hypothetical protein CV944_16055 [Geobacillus sp. WSUCF-018B]
MRRNKKILSIFAERVRNVSSQKDFSRLFENKISIIIILTTKIKLFDYEQLHLRFIIIFFSVKSATFFLLINFIYLTSFQA